MIKLYKKLFIPKNTIQGHLPYLTERLMGTGF